MMPARTTEPGKFFDEHGKDFTGFPDQRFMDAMRNLSRFRVDFNDIGTPGAGNLR
jgi:hypothetical protein